MTTKDLVLIEWEDSTQPHGAWSWLEGGDVGEVWSEAVRCQSVGWLVYDGEDVKALAPNWGQLCGDHQVSGVIRIPTRAIIKITRLVQVDKIEAAIATATDALAPLAGLPGAPVAGPGG